MSPGRGFFTRLYFLEEPDDSDATEAEQSDPAEDINEGPEKRLLADLLIDLSAACGHSIGAAHLAAKEARNHARLLLKPVAGARDRADDVVLVKVAAAREHGLRCGNSDRSADILRSRLKMPLALPISSFLRVA